MQNNFKMDDELYHFGIKGQRWGVRRYQNPDGSLTALGKKKYGTKSNFEKVQAAKKAASGSRIKAQLDREKANARTQAEIEKYRKKAAKKLGKSEDQEVESKDESTEKKTKGSMTNEELRTATDRINLERNYIDAQKNYIISNQQLSQVKPQKVSKGKEFAKKIWKEAVEPAVVNAGKQYLEKTLKETLGLKDDSMSALKKKAQEAEYRKKIYDAEKARREVEGKPNDNNNNNNNKKDPNKNSDNNTNKNEKKDKKSQSDKNSDKKVYSGDVEGKGTSKYTEKSKFSNSTFVDGEFEEIHKTDINNGRDYVNNLLRIETKSNNLLQIEDKKMKHSETGGETIDNELYHFGIKGQRWGVRRYQNPDGSLTALGRQRQKQLMESDKETVIAKGTKLYRISSNNKSDTSDGKIYVNASKEGGDYYITSSLATNMIMEKGKIYIHEYIATKDIKLPDKKTMEKIELGLLKDKKIQRELVDSLMKKGLSREEATSRVQAYNAGKAFVQKTGEALAGAYAGGIVGGYVGGIAGSAAGPAGSGTGLAVGAGVGAVAGAATTVKNPSQERQRALSTTRVSYGDRENKVINETLRNELSKKGYRGLKDYNDRRAFGKYGNNATIIFDSNKNIKLSKVSEVTAKDYGKSYAKNYLKMHPKSKLDFEDLVKDGEKRYKEIYEAGVIDREKEKERKRLLEKAKKKA